MFRGLPASILVHVGIFATSYIALPYTNNPVQLIEIVPVDIVTISEVTNVKAVVARRTEVPPEIEPEIEPVAEAPEEERPEDLELPPEESAPTPEDIAPPPPQKVEPPEPEDIVPEEKKPEPKKKEPEPKPKPKPKPKPEDDKPKKDALDDLLASDPFSTERTNLIDRSPKAAPKAASPAQNKLPQPLNETPASRVGRRAVGEGTANEVRVEALLWAQMVSCWGTVEDLPDPERLTVTVRVKLKRDGTLDGDAELMSRRASIGDRFMQQAVERALSAVRRCAPYQLPEDDYDLWNEITLNFKHER